MPKAKPKFPAEILITREGPATEPWLAVNESLHTVAEIGETKIAGVYKFVRTVTVTTSIQVG